MGQKTPPKANRLGITEEADSKLFANFKGGKFAQALQEDTTIREYLKKKLKNAGLSKVLVERKPGSVQVNIVTARPGLIFGKGNEGLDQIKSEITALINRPELQFNVNVFEVNKVDIDAQLVAQSVAQQLERRIAFRRAMKGTIQRTMRAGALGIKVEVSGRLGGAEIARSERSQEGSVPCHTWRADIDYAQAKAFTTYGIIGIKVWINKSVLRPGEKSKPNLKAAAGANEANAKQELVTGVA